MEQRVHPRGPDPFRRACESCHTISPLVDILHHPLVLGKLEHRGRLPVPPAGPANGWDAAARVSGRKRVSGQCGAAPVCLGSRPAPQVFAKALSEQGSSVDSLRDMGWAGLVLRPRLEMSCCIVRGTAAYHGLSGGPSGRRRGCVSISACVAARCVSVTSVPPPTQPPTSTWCAAAQQRRAVARRHRRILSCGLGAVTRGYSLVCVRSLARVCSLGLRVCGYGATAQPAA